MKLSISEYAQIYASKTKLNKDKLLKHREKLRRVKGSVTIEQRKEKLNQNKFREKVRGVYRLALRHGEIKSEPCIVCGSEQVDGHHHDYEKPLDVIWLCQKHHSELHANLRLKAKICD